MPPENVEKIALEDIPVEGKTGESGETESQTTFDIPIDLTPVLQGLFTPKKKGGDE